MVKKLYPIENSLCPNLYPSLCKEKYREKQLEDSGIRAQDQDRGVVSDFIIVRYHCEVNKRIDFPILPYEIVIIRILIV